VRAGVEAMNPVIVPVVMPATLHIASLFIVVLMLMLVVMLVPVPPPTLPILLLKREDPHHPTLEDGHDLPANHLLHPVPENVCHILCGRLLHPRTLSDS
jgi:hypothetical protein